MPGPGSANADRDSDARSAPLREHLSIFVKPEPGALVFPGAMGGPLRRSNFNKMSAWPYAVRSVGAQGLHVHDLRHTGNTFAEMSRVAPVASFGRIRERC